MPRIKKKELEKFLKDHPKSSAAKAIKEQLKCVATDDETKSTLSAQKEQIFDSAENLTADEAAIKVNILQNKILQGCIDIVEYSIELGHILFEQKQSLKHGQWLDWINQSIDLGYTQVSHYIRIYKKRDDIRQKMDELREQGLKPSFRKMLTAITKKDTKTLPEYQTSLKMAEEVRKQKEQDRQNNISLARRKEIALITEMYNSRMIDANAAKAMQDRWNIYHPKDEFKFYDLFETDDWGSRSTVDVTLEVDRKLWTQYYVYLHRHPEEFSKVINDYMQSQIEKCRETQKKESA
jgi:hypothetical protein